MNFITENQTEYQALFTFWQKQEAEIVVRFDAKRHFTEEEKQEVFKQVATEAVYLHNLYCGVSKEIACTFDIDTDPDYFLGHLVDIRLDDNYRLSLETISG